MLSNKSGNVIHKPIYFGQKDLSATGEGFEKDLVDKLIGSKLDLVGHEIDEQKIRVCEIVDRLTKVVNIKEQIEEQRDIKLGLLLDFGVLKW